MNVAADDLNAETAAVTVKERIALGSDSAAFVGDVSDDTFCRSMIDGVVERYGRIDILVNNAGICPIRFIDTITAEQFERSMRINLFSVFMCSKLAAAYMKKQGEGLILNAASQAAYTQHMLQ